MATVNPPSQSTDTTSAQSSSIADFLSLLHPSSQTFEVRAPKCPERRGGKFLSTAAGYFNNPADAAKFIRRLDTTSQPAGIYVTANPVSPSLIARSANQGQFRAEHLSTDTDIIQRRWLFVDIDSKRPSGVSATDEELSHAIQLADDAQSEISLLSSGVSPLFCMSGNGAYLLYRIDLPNDETTRDFIKEVLRGLAARLDNPHACIDTSTFNAGRIIKAIGTHARKGSDFGGAAGVEARPHRKTWFRLPGGDDSEASLQCLPLEVLQEIAGWAPNATNSSTSNPNGSGVNGKGMARHHSPTIPVDDAVARCRKYIEKIPNSISGSDGSGAILRAACECFKYGLSDEAAWQELLWFNDHRTGGEPWSEKELRHKFDDAKEKVEILGEFGCRLDPDERYGPSHIPHSYFETLVGSPCPNGFRLNGKWIIDADGKPTSPAIAPPGTTPPEPPAASSSSPSPGEDLNAGHRQVLAQIGVSVLGHYADANRTALILNEEGQVYKIDKIGRLAFIDLAQMISAARMANVEADASNTSSTLLSMDAVRQAIAFISAESVIPDDGGCGYGVWTSDRHAASTTPPTLLVSDGSQVAEWDGSTVHIHKQPRTGGRFFDFSLVHSPWVNIPKIESLLSHCSNPKFRESKYLEIRDRCFAPFSWVDSRMADVATSLVIASIIQHVWEWRPTILLTGESNSGKSYLFGYLEALLGKLCKPTIDISTAGIRAAIQNKMLVPIYDEADADSKKQKQAREEFFKMIRGTNRGQWIIRATSNQKENSFLLRHMFWISGVQSPVDDNIDRNRMIMLHLLGESKRKSHDDFFGKLASIESGEVAELGQAAIALALWSALEAKKLAAANRNLEKKHYKNLPETHPRQIESYAVPAAIRSLMVGMDMTASLVDFLELIPKTEGHTIEDDFTVAIEAMLNSQIRSRDYDSRLVRKWLSLATYDSESVPTVESARALLENHGIRVDYPTRKEIAGLASQGTEVDENEPCLLVCADLVNQLVLRGRTPWEGSNRFRTAMMSSKLTFSNQRKVDGRNMRLFVMPLRCVVDVDREPERQSAYASAGF